MFANVIVPVWATGSLIGIGALNAALGAIGAVLFEGVGVLAVVVLLTWKTPLFQTNFLPDLIQVNFTP
jgi:hypothetical protein